MVNYSKEDFLLHFLITVEEPYREYRFTMENKNMSGNWCDIFETCDKGTKITFTEEVEVKNPIIPIMNLFVKGYLKNSSRILLI